MTEWQWIGLSVVHALHDRQLAEHGGPSGVRDQGLLESALGRPVNAAADGSPDAAALAAAYAFGLARNHAFIDGNKRTAWICARLFLKINAVELRFDKREALTAMMALAAGDLSEEELADWFRTRIAAGLGSGEVRYTFARSSSPPGMSLLARFLEEGHRRHQPGQVALLAGGR